MIESGVDATLESVLDNRYWEIFYDTRRTASMASITFAYDTIADGIGDLDRLTIAFRSDYDNVWTVWDSVEVNFASSTITAHEVDAGAGHWAFAVNAYNGPVWNVATTGSDSTGDGSADNPFAIIQTGIDAASDGDTVLVAAGTFVEPNVPYYGNGYSAGPNLYEKNNLVIMSDGNGSATIDLDDHYYGFCFSRSSTNNIIDGFTIKNAEYLLISAMNGSIDNTFKNCVFLTIDGESFSYSTYDAGHEIINCTFIGDSTNQAIYNYENAPSIINSIVYNYDEFIGSNYLNDVTIDYSLLHGVGGTLPTGDNLLFADPLFCNPDSGDYTLAENSPCVGTGENGANMGAFGVGCGAIFTPPELVINEFLASNEACCTDENGDYDDYIEIYNYGDEAVDIGGLFIADDIGNYDDYYQIPAGNDSTIIQPGDFLLLWADKESEQGVLHVEIKLSSDGEQIGLFMPDSTTVVDTLTFGEQSDDVSYGRYPDGSDTWQLMNPTPGAANTQELSLDEALLIPEVFVLHQNYPNPFNPITTLRYDLPEQATVNIIIYDIMGREVKTLINQTQDAGYRSIIWDATNDYGKPVSAGIYLYQIQAGDFVQTRKMVLLK
jgi:hypothetical protein